MSNVDEIKKKLIASAKRLYQKNYLAACDGNLSYRINDSRILITPKGKPKVELTPKDFAVIDIHGHLMSGEPSSERLMHLSVYQHCPKAKCVIHAHPPTAIAWTIAYPKLKALPNECMSELIIAAGKIPIAPYALPGSLEMGTAIEPLLSKHRIIILARHGALCWGESIQEATNAMERLEHSAEILMRAKQLGGLTKLSKTQTAALYKIREGIGEMVDIIYTLKIRGAPLVGVAAALALARYVEQGANHQEILQAAATLIAARPTAVNLSYCIDRLLKRYAQTQD